MNAFLREHLGKSLSTLIVMGFVALATLGYNLGASSLNAYAEEIAEKMVDEIFEERKAEFADDIKEQLSDTTRELGDTQTQLKGTRSQVGELQKNLTKIEGMLEVLIKQNRTHSTFPQ